MSKNKKGSLLSVIKTHKWETLFLILFLIPVFIQTNFLNVGTWLLNLINIGKPANWLGFWGSYLGSILAIVFAYINTKAQLKESKQNDLDNAIKINKINNSTVLLNNIMAFLSKLDTIQAEIVFNTKMAKRICDIKYKNLNNLNNDWIDYITKWNTYAVTSNSDEIKNISDLINSLSIPYHKILETYSPKIQEIIDKPINDPILDEDKKIFKDTNSEMDSLRNNCIILVNKINDIVTENERI